MSTCKLPEEFQRESLDVQILRCIALLGSPNISQMADMVGKPRNRIRPRLYVLKGMGYVKDRWELRCTPFNNLIRCHEFQLRRRGKRLLREGEPMLQVFLRDGSLPVWNPKVQPRSEDSAVILPPRGDQASQVNYDRSKKAADILRAFSIAQRTPRSR